MTRPTGTLELSADYALICTGRSPRLRVEELSALGIRHDRCGIVVDSQQMTSVPGIYAIGDVTGGMMLAHRAMQQGKTLAASLFGGRKIRFLEDTVPTVIYYPSSDRPGRPDRGRRHCGRESPSRFTVRILPQT